MLVSEEWDNAGCSIKTVSTVSNVTLMSEDDLTQSCVWLAFHKTVVQFHYLVHQFLPQSAHNFRVQAQEHDQRGGCAGCGFMAPKQQFCSRLLNSLETENQFVSLGPNINNSF